MIHKKYFSIVIVVFITLLIILDQWSKIYVKTHFRLYENYPVIGQWFQLYFIENKGMAFGFDFGGSIGKVLLTLIRVVAVIVGGVFIKRVLQKSLYPVGLIIFISLIYAGAIGNTLDSLFYGLIFNESTALQMASLFPAEGGYETFLFGKVVDMLYFPLIRTVIPDWVPFWGGQPFEFFSPIFNIADSCVTTGMFGIILFYHKVLAGKKIH